MKELSSHGIKHAEAEEKYYQHLISQTATIELLKQNNL